MSYFNFNDLTELMWGKFNRPFKEVNRYQLYKKEGKGYVMVVNALGIKKEDIKVSLVPAEASQEKYPRLTITGSTETPYIEDKYSIDISMLLLIKEKIEAINYDCKDGLCYIFIRTKSPEIEPQIEIKALDGKFDW